MGGTNIELRGAGRRLFALGAVTLASLMASCVGADDESEPISTVRQGAAAVFCGCVANGESQQVPCYDTCFPGQAQCGDPNGPCSQACQFDPNGFQGPQEACETGDPLAPGGPLVGQCAHVGVGPDNRPGCCLGCLDTSDPSNVYCGGPQEVQACGNAGEECRRCTDDVTSDCMVPVCQGGSCLTVPRMVGVDCANDGGDSGRCAANGSCCSECLTPSGNCHPQGLSDSGACGRGGEDCRVCDDGDVCNGTERCSQGTCQPVGDAPDCNDNNPCTMDTCDPNQGGCVGVPNVGQVCSDGDPCTTGDACDSDGECRSGDGVNCDDGNDCTVDICGSTGLCQNQPRADGEACVDDASTCGSTGVCDSGRCTLAANCHDESNPCLTSDCETAGTCMEVAKPDGTACDDGDPCTTGDSCDGGSCVGGDAPDCDDNNPCTDDSCDPDDGCLHEDSDTQCTDGNPCTSDDRCSGGVCVGEPRDCDPTNSCQASGLCDPVSGVCAFTNKENGAKCGDDGECKGGVCDGANGTGSGAGGTGGGAASGGTGGDDGAAGEAGSGGDTSSGLGGTFSGPDFDRKPQGCDCRQAPGSLPRGATWLGWLGLLGFAARRRPRVTS